MKPTVIGFRILFALIVVLMLSVKSQTMKAATAEQSVYQAKTWPAIQTPYGAVAKLKTVMRSTNYVSYRLEVVSKGYLGNLTVVLLDKDGFRLAKDHFLASGTQAYTGELYCDVSTYSRAASWDLLDGIY